MGLNNIDLQNRVLTFWGWFVDLVNGWVLVYLVGLNGMKYLYGLVCWFSWVLIWWFGRSVFCKSVFVQGVLCKFVWLNGIRVI